MTQMFLVKDRDCDNIVNTVALFDKLKDAEVLVGILSKNQYYHPFIEVMEVQTNTDNIDQIVFNYLYN